MQINQHIEQGKSYNPTPETENTPKPDAPPAQIPPRIRKPDKQPESRKARPGTTSTATIGTAQKISLLPVNNNNAFVQGRNFSAPTSAKEAKSAPGSRSGNAAPAAHPGTVREVDAGARQLQQPERQSPLLRSDSNSREIDLIDVAPESITPAVQRQFQHFHLNVKNLKENMPPDIRQQASNFIRDRINQTAHIDINPDEIYVNNFDGAQALDDGNDGVTGYQHNKKDLKNAVTLTDFVLRGFDDAWRGSRSDLLNLHFGLYNTNSAEKNYGAHNEIKILPSDLRKMFGTGDLERYLTAKQESFWSGHQSQWQSLARSEFSALARKAALDGQLGRQGYELVMKGAASNVPLDTAATMSHLAYEATPDASVEVHRFDINGYSSTDILRFSGKSGSQVLYIPGETQAFYEFKSEDALKDWVVRQTQDPTAHQELASHFSIYDRSKGNWGALSATGVGEALDNIASQKWNKNNIDVGNSVIRSDVFRDMAERTRQRGKDDLLQITDNADKRKMWLNDLTQADSMPYGRPVARALSAGNFAANVAAQGRQSMTTGRQDVREAAGMNVGLTLLFAPRDDATAAKPSTPRAAPAPSAPSAGNSRRQTEFRATEFPPGNATEAFNEINERMQAIAGPNNVRQYRSLSELEKSSAGGDNATRLKRVRNSLDEVYARLNSANNRLHNVAEKGDVLESLAKSLGTADERTLSQTYERLQGLSAEAFSRFKAIRDDDYRKITFFERKDKGTPLADEQSNSPTSAFSNLKDRNRIMLNLDGPDEGQSKLAESEAARRYNAELVDSVINQLTRISGNTQDYANIRKDETKDGFALGSAKSALAQFTSDSPNDALCRRVLGKEPDYPDDASVMKILGMTGEHPVNDYMRENARHRYNIMSDGAEKSGAITGRTYSDQQRRDAAERIRKDDMLRADLMTSNADTAALYLRDIGAKRNYDVPPSLDYFLDEIRRKSPIPMSENAIHALANKLLMMDAQSALHGFQYYQGSNKMAGYAVEDADGKLHVFPTESEAANFQSRTVFWQHVGEKLKNPLGTVLETVGMIAGLPPEKNRRLFEIGNNPLGKVAAFVGYQAGASEDTQTKLAQVGEYAEAAIPVWGQARFYSGLAGKAMKGEPPTTDELQGVTMDTKDIASGAGSRHVVSTQKTGVKKSTPSPSPAVDATNQANPGAPGARETLRRRLKTIQTVGLGGKGAPNVARKWGAEDGHGRPGGVEPAATRGKAGNTQSTAGSFKPVKAARAKNFRANRGGAALASKAQSFKKFDQNRYSYFKKDNPSGVCQGLSFEALRRIDRGSASKVDLLSAVKALKEGLKKSSPDRAALVGSIQSKQDNRNLAGLTNYERRPSKVYRGDRQMSINQLENDIRNLAPNDVAALGMKITGKHGETLPQGHMLLVQRLGDQKYQLFDPNNGAFSYRTEDSLRNALESYMDAAYSDRGVMRPDSFMRYRYRAAAGQGQGATSSTPTTAAQSGASPKRPASSGQPDAQQPFGKDYDFPFIDQAPTGSSGPAAGDTQGVRLTAGNVQNELPGLTPAGQKSAVRYLSEVAPNRPVVVRNQQDIDNATRFFNAGAKLKLVGGGGGGGGDGNAQPTTTGKAGRRVSADKRAVIGEYIRRHPDETDISIGRRFGVSSKVVNTVRHNLGLTRTSGAGVAIPAERRAAIADYIRRHPDETDVQIGQHFHVVGSTIGKIRRDFGMESPRGIARLTPERKAAIADYMRKNPAALDNDIAARFQVSKTTVNLIRHDLGLQRNSGRGVYLTAEQKAEMTEYIHQHPEMMSSEIAAHFKVSASTINRLRYSLEADHRSHPAPTAGPSTQPTAGPSTEPVAGPSTAPDQWAPEAPPSTHHQQEAGAQPQPGSSVSPAVFDDEQVIQWMFGHLPPQEVDRIINVPDEQFPGEIMRIRQRMTDEQSSS